tara:strand:+ start:1897 stop:2802 length:906 start_codon:yes stop_codon:yes gene_type:complete
MELTMKLILENWRNFLKAGGYTTPSGIPPMRYRDEDDFEQKIYSFDFDNTLIRYRTLEDGDVEYLGPHEENIQLVKDLASEGNKVIIVTSRCKLVGEKKPWDDAPTPEELVAELALPIKEIYYTYTNLKANKLVELGVSNHWDDDEDEIKAAEAAGIDAVLVPVEGEVTGRLRDKWINCLGAEADSEDLSESKKVFYVSINMVLPTEELGHGKDHDCPSTECEDAVEEKMSNIQGGHFKPIEVCNQKPVKTYRAQGDGVGNAPKSGISEPFYHVMNGHHRLEAAKRLGLTRVPVYLTSEEN